MHDTQRVLYYQVVSVIGQLNCNGGCLLEQNLSFVGGIFPKTSDDSLDSDSHLNMSTQVQHHPCYLRFVQMSSFFSMQLCLVIGKQWDVTQKYFLIKQKNIYQQLWGHWCRWPSGRGGPRLRPRIWTCRWWWGPRCGELSSSPWTCIPVSRHIIRKYLDGVVAQLQKLCRPQQNICES